MKTIHFILSFVFLLAAVPAWAQQDSLAVQFERIRSADSDSCRIVYAGRITGILKNMKFGSYATSSPVKYLGYKQIANASAELFSWSVPVGSGAVFYNLFRFKEGGCDYLLRSAAGEGGQISPYLFYDLLPFDSGDKTYFILLGWNCTKNTNQKAVLVAAFEEDGRVNFNNPLLRRGNSRSASLVFEYARDGSMTLKYDPRKKRIVFDHLVPSEKKYEGYFMFYGPDASYDALQFRKGEWWYEENIKVKGEKQI